MRADVVFDGIEAGAARRPVPSDAPFTDTQLFNRPDAKATVERLLEVVAPEAPDPELVVILTARVVLCARAAAERAASTRGGTR